MFSRKCPECGTDVFHKTASSCRRAHKNHRCCRKCALEQTRRTTQSPEWRAAQSVRLTNAWNDPDSTFNTPDYRIALAEGQFERKRNETPEETAARCQCIAEAWANDDGSWLEAVVNSGKNTVNIEARRKGNIIAWANNPERHVKQSIDARKRMEDPEYKERCTRKLIEAAIRTGGKSKAEKAIVDALEPYGFLGYQRVGSYYVDALNENTKTIVEYFGDWWHVHPRVHDRINADYGGIHPQVGLTISEIQCFDEHRLTALREMGYNVIVVWERDIRRGKRIDTSHVIELVQRSIGSGIVSS